MFYLAPDTVDLHIMHLYFNFLSDNPLLVVVSFRLHMKGCLVGRACYHMSNCELLVSNYIKSIYVNPFFVRNSRKGLRKAQSQNVRDTGKDQVYSKPDRAHLDRAETSVVNTFVIR